MAKESVIEKMKHKMQPPPPPKEVSISEATESMRKVLEKQVSEETMRKEQNASGWHKFTMSMKIWQSLPVWCTTSART